MGRCPGMAMQITPLPTTAAPNALPQDTAVKAGPQSVMAQASPPVTQRAIDPAPKSERGNKSRSNGDKAKGGGKNGGRGGNVNLRV